MKTYKQIDYYGNYILLIAIVLVAIINKEAMYLGSFYLVFSVWHIQSVVIHIIHKKESYYHNKRRAFALLVFMVCFALCSLILLKEYNFVQHDVFNVIAWPLFVFLLIFSPAFAVFYIIICNKELKEMKRRPLSYFK